MKKFLSILLLFSLLTGCTVAAPNLLPDPTEPSIPKTSEIPEESTLESTPVDPIDAILSQLPLEEWVGQLLLARCNSETAIADIQTYHLGGFVMFGADFQDQTPDSLRNITQSYQDSSTIPMLLAVDEEGGTVTRISRYSAFRESPFPSLRQSWKAGGMEQILELEIEKCQLLKSLGLNVNLGPVCDISDDPDAFMYQRSLGQNAQTTASVVSQIVETYSQQGVGSVLKHFPGYGNNVDTHTGIALDSRSMQELEERDLIPFVSGMASGCGAILVSHNVVEALDPDLPASLSPAVHQYLRNTLGFDGVIMTDDLVMEAITQRYGAGEAAVMAVLAGNDLLCVTDYQVQYEALVDAVLTGRIPFETLETAVKRVLKWKQQLGLIG